MTLNPTIKTLNRLKNTILKMLKSSVSLEKMKLFNYKGIELDDADIEYLNPGQIIYLSLDGASFSVLNYMNETKFIKWIKQGGYGKVYSGKYLFLS